jgi:hypothetical protein
MAADLELTVTLIATISRIEPGQVDLSLVIELDYIHVVTLIVTCWQASTLHGMMPYRPCCSTLLY